MKLIKEHLLHFQDWFYFAKKIQNQINTETGYQVQEQTWDLVGEKVQVTEKYIIHKLRDKYKTFGNETN